MWKMSRNATICKVMKIHFRKNFSKEDREAYAHLWAKGGGSKVKGTKIISGMFMESLT